MWGLALLLALAAGPVFALGLGQIEVKSQRDQPLLAEIPIVSSDPSELEQLQARLASPDTFARIGLDPPQGVVSDLQFTVALDAQGRPVIRVTSSAPVQQPLLTFLVEVDWGQGRLVREYSALLDAPRTVAAPAQPIIQAPTAPSNTIDRPLETPLATTIPTAPESTPAPAPASPATPAPAAQPLEPPPQTTDIASNPPPIAAPTPEPIAPLPTPVAQASDASSYAVKRGDTLGEIARGVGAPGYSLDQTMLALLRANPDAFIDGNINLVKQGAVLRMPDAAEQGRLNANEAAAMVHDQIEQWRDARQPALQPTAIAGDSQTKPVSRDSANQAPRVAGARLEIVPPSSNSARRAGTRSGIQAGGEGDMQRQELQQTKETLAARDSEVQELKSRVTDLEKLQQQQQQLIALKDSELAAAQQRLAASNQSAAAKTAPAQTTTITQAPPAAQSNSMPWIWGGVALLAIALLAWWLSQRSKRPAEPPRAFNTAALAASIPPTDIKSVNVAPPTAVDSRTDPISDFTPVDPVVAPASPSKPAFIVNNPKSAPKPAPIPAPKSAPEPTPSAPAWSADSAIMPTWHADGSSKPAKSIPVADPVPVGHERLELARAYIDLGDVDTARTLLLEVQDNGDADARGEALRLLRELT
ncbi:MAG: FimV/HubP family polar landmark protein [Luteimonas sp.]